MSWHDNRVYGIAFNPSKYELIFDIDYILLWVKPEDGNRNYNF